MTSPAVFTAPPATSLVNRYHFHRHAASMIFDASTVKPPAHSMLFRPRFCRVATPAHSAPIAGRRKGFAPVRASDSATFVDDPVEATPSPAAAEASFPTEEEQMATTAEAKIGTRVRVSVPLKVFHVPKVPEIDLTGKEGVLKQYVGVWKGKRISANLPFRVEFVVDVEGRKPVKFFAHLKEDEFEFLE